MTPSYPARVRAFLSGSRIDPTSKPPSFLALRSSTLFIVLTVCLAIFTDILCYGLIVPVIPFSLSVQAGVPENQVQQWTAILLACYNAALFVGSPVAGFYADRTSSRRLPLLIGLLALAASTLLLCLGNTVTLLILGRLLQGLSAAVVWSVGLALLVDTKGRNVGQSMGYVSIAMSVGLLISPVIGGAVYAAEGYYAVFYIAFAVIACDIVLRLVLIEKKIARQWVDFDGHHSIATGPDAIVGSSGQSEPVPRSGGDDSSHVPGEKNDLPGSPGRAGSDSGRATAATPDELQQSARHPHLELIKSRRILAVLLGVVIEAAIVFGFDTVVPIFVRDTFQWNSTAAGLVFICVMVPGFASPLVGMLTDRYGARWPAVAGFAASVPLLVCLRFVSDNTLEHKILLCALLALLGATLLALANTPLMAEMTYAIDAQEASQPGFWGENGVYGIAYGLWTTAFALGGTIGSIMSGYLHAGPGWATMAWSLALWSFVGAVVTLGLGPASSKPKYPGSAASPTACAG
ncbi:major facilitator superfamily domain-containing protein [Podospora appendiculata]|uniref:Major facilitator superfamily domain-containing protein n=1 Tax=Podospora appendiculata TaxID=314037 RepID=A0AAE0X5R2_9PEZI|nr:major facilitator superfamily domain-containing protein [Podospora appendiculata]